jgi:hypothetical protein
LWTHFDTSYNPENDFTSDAYDQYLNMTIGITEWRRKKDRIRDKSNFGTALIPPLMLQIATQVLIFGFMKWAAMMGIKSRYLPI